MSEIHKIKHELDVQLIGSDISIRAVETASNNVTHANLDSYQDLFNVSEKQVINEPLVFCEHWPKSFTQHDTASSNQLINFGGRETKILLESLPRRLQRTWPKAQGTDKRLGTLYGAHEHSIR